MVGAFADGTFAVATGDGALLVDESASFVGTEAPRVGERFGSADFVAQMRAIVARHQARHPDLPLSPDILLAAALA